MTDESKIVDLRRAQAPTAPTEPLPVPIEALKKTSQRFLTDGFAQMLDALDDALFELADEASSPKDQQYYFEAMHEVWVRRQDMEARFEANLENAYSQMLHAQPLSAVERGQAKLRVLESDALEELVAVEGMAKRAERRFTQEIWVLCTAWQHCVNGPVLAARDLPMGPAKITQALTAALEDISLQIKAKLVLLKLFERHVLDNYSELCRELVPVLQSHGLPSEFKAVPEKKEAPAQQDKKSAANQTQEEAREQLTSDATYLANKLFDTLDNLVSVHEEQGVGKKPEMVLSKPSLMVALQDMQNEQFSQLNVRGSVRGRDVAQAEAELAKQLISRLERVSKVSAADASALSEQHDRDTIQFVGALFQYILEGDVLSRELKSVIARLQIPILKMAMLDKNFFSHDEHPARKLLSGLLGAGIGWSPSSEPEKDPLYLKVEEIVMRVLRDFGVDTQIFVDAYDDFMSFSAKDRRRAELLAKRAADVAGGRAIAEQARGYIKAFLDQKLGQGAYPPVVSNMLREGWSRVLFLSYVQEGRESARLAEDLKTVERLLWSVEPVGSAQRRAELIDRLPALVEALREGFNRASLNAFETSQWFEQLERLHLSRLARPSNASRTDDSVTAPSAAMEESRSPVNGDMSSPFMPSAEPMTAEQEETQGKVAALRVGNWVDFRQENGKMMRCRLAAVINGIGKYIFVNRSGIKVAEFDRDGLVDAIQDQRLFLIEDGRLFDRALESVISNLRDMKDRPME